MDYTGMRKTARRFSEQGNEDKGLPGQKGMACLVLFPALYSFNLLIKLSYPGYKSRLEDGTAGSLIA